ncbi:hypothetical protein Adt_13493 [Abeliophyllum distichum]|uniref:Uncharacterized protein n=1 Tax=Abeliophyllum distichum TaxID=126358 RepID=A0ABD1TWY7_9LAMI
MRRLLPVLPSMEGVLPIRGVDGSTGDAISIDVAPSLREADDPFRADVVRWAALDVPSIMVEEDLKKLKEVAPNGWSQMVGDMYLWFRHSFGLEMPLHVFQTINQPRKLPKKKDREEEAGWYFFYPWGLIITY